MRSESKQLEKTMQNRHTTVTNFVDNKLNGTSTGDVKKMKKNDDNDDDDGDASSHKIEGYLFKRTSKGFKSWNRRWFYMCNNQLVYRKRGDGDMPTVMEEDLRICTVRPVNDSDRRFCFEVISPTK